jgi:hypothetical protein
MSSDISESRERLRSLLIEEDGRSFDPVVDSFPRSKVMRFLFDPEIRKLLMAAGATAGLVLTRHPLFRHIGTVAMAARAIKKTMSARD